MHVHSYIHSELFLRHNESREIISLENSIIATCLRKSSEVIIEATWSACPAVTPGQAAIIYV